MDASRPLGPSSCHLDPLLGGGEEVAVDFGQAGEVVDVLVQVGDADYAAGAELVGQVVDVAGVALGQGLVVGEVGGDALGQVLVAELLGQGRGQVFDLARAARRRGSGPC